MCGVMFTEQQYVAVHVSVVSSPAQHSPQLSLDHTQQGCSWDHQSLASGSFFRYFVMCCPFRQRTVAADKARAAAKVPLGIVQISMKHKQAASSPAASAVAGMIMPGRYCAARSDPDSENQEIGWMFP